MCILKKTYWHWSGPSRCIQISLCNEIISGIKTINYNSDVKILYSVVLANNVSNGWS